MNIIRRSIHGADRENNLSKSTNETEVDTIYPLSLIHISMCIRDSFLTEQTLDFVLHRLFCGLAEMHPDDIGGLADLLSDSRARGVGGGLSLIHI